MWGILQVYNYYYILSLQIDMPPIIKTRDGLRWGPEPPLGPKFSFFLVILYFIFVVGPPFSLISLTSLI